MANVANCTPTISPPGMSGRNATGAVFYMAVESLSQTLNFVVEALYSTGTSQFVEVSARLLKSAICTHLN